MALVNIRELTEDETCNERPITFRTDENGAKIRDLVHSDRQNDGEELDLNHSTVNQVLTTVGDLESLCENVAGTKKQQEAHVTFQPVHTPT